MAVLRRRPDMSVPVRAIGRLLVANRGEIAVRVRRTAHAMGMHTVAVLSDLGARVESGAVLGVVDVDA